MTEGGSRTHGVAAGFLELPSGVYAGDPMWIPEDSEATRRAFSPDNVWFTRGSARTWCVPGSTRVAAFLGPDQRIDGERAAFFGYWETVDDVEVNRCLFASLVAWARDRGAKSVYGPINFNTYGLYRLRTEVEPGGVTFPGEP